MAGPGIKAVLFDWGGVLTSPPLSEMRALEASLGYAHRQMVNWLFHTGLAPDGSGAVAEEDFPLLEKAKIPQAEFQRRVLARSAEHLGRPMSAESFAAIWGPIAVDAGITAVHWVMIERARELRRAGYRTAIVTNQIPSWREFWRSSVPVDDFDLVVDSCVVGLRKPEPAMLYLACNGLGVEPHEAVLLDDSRRNIDGAREAGLSAILVRDPVQAIVELDALLGVTAP
jgi:epoxide hydrolase-like predicted phosphatase